MTANTSNRGYTYPQSGDHDRIWEHFQELAQDIDVDVEALADRIAVLEGPPHCMTAISHNFGTGAIEQIQLSGSPQWNVGSMLSGDTMVVPGGGGGLYEAGIVARFASQTTAAGQRNARIYKNGVEEMSFTLPAVSNLNSTNIIVTGVYELVLAAADIITFLGFQNSGGSLALTGNSRAWLRRIDQ